MGLKVSVLALGAIISVLNEAKAWTMMDVLKEGGLSFTEERCSTAPLLRSSIPGIPPSPSNRCTTYPGKVSADASGRLSLELNGALTENPLPANTTIGAITNRLSETNLTIEIRSHGDIERYVFDIEKNASCRFRKLDQMSYLKLKNTGIGCTFAGTVPAGSYGDRGGTRDAGRPPSRVDSRCLVVNSEVVPIGCAMNKRWYKTTVRSRGGRDCPKNIRFVYSEPDGSAANYQITPETVQTCGGPAVNVAPDSRQ